MGLVLLGVLCGPLGCRSGEPAAGGVEDYGLRLRDARRPAPEKDPDVLGRAGSVTIDVAGLRAAVDEARVTQQWHRGEAPPLGALGDRGLRRRLLVEALERRVVRAEVARRGITADPDRLDEMLRLGAVGYRLDRPPTPEQLAEARALPVDRIEPQLVARFGVPAERVRRAALDVLEGGLLTAALLDAVDEATLRQAWLDAHTEIVLDVIRVGRVPTPGEVDAAIEQRASEMPAFYEKNRALFGAPERAFLRRVFVPVEADATPAARAAAKARAEGLRAKVAGGADLDAVIAEAAPPREARRGGRLTVTRAQLPAAFEGPEGRLSPVEATSGGWHFYRVDRRAAAVHRGLDDVRVKREIAASLLREADDLPHAKRVAGEAAVLLRDDPDGAALAKLVEESRAQRSTTTPFSPGGAPIVPGIGIAPELYRAALALDAPGQVTPVMTVRQDYVVARLVSRTRPDAAAWPAERAAFVASWRAAHRGQAIERWLDERLRGQPTWVDGERLAALSLAELGVDATSVADGGAGVGGGDGGSVDGGRDAGAR